MMLAPAGIVVYACLGKQKGQPMPKNTDRPAKNAAKAFSALGASKGGQARAASLSPAERAEIASTAASARWGSKPVPTAICGSPDRPLKIGDVEIQCYVLDNGKRVITQRGLARALDTSSGGGDARKIPRLLGGEALKSYADRDFLMRSKPIKFKAPSAGKYALGYEAELLVDICKGVLAARRAGELHANQEHIAVQCEILLEGFSRVGIIALIDEATGYQEVRSRDDLARILEKFIAKELREWVRTFPVDYYKEIYRLRGWGDFGKRKNHPGQVGKITNDVVYKRLAPGVLEALQDATPRKRGITEHRFHQRLTDDVGHPKLKEHLAGTVALLKTASSWDDFIEKIDKVYPEQPGREEVLRAEKEAESAEPGKDE